MPKRWQVRRKRKRRRQGKGGEFSRMGRFLIFIAALILLSFLGMVVWKVWNKLYIDMKRQESLFDIEKEAHEKLKKEIKEDKES